MYTYALLAALSLVGPYALYWLFSHVTAIERVTANLAIIDWLGRKRYSKDSDNAIAFLEDGRKIYFDVSLARSAQLRSTTSIKAAITLSRKLAGASYVSSVQWPGEAAEEVVTRNDGALYLAVCYLMLAMSLTCYALEPNVYAALGHWGTNIPALLSVLSGLVWGKLHAKPLPADTRVSMLGGLIGLGTGPNAIFASAIIASSLTLVCYWLGGLGLIAGLSLGCTAGMLFGCWLNGAAPTTTISAAPRLV